MALKLEIPDSLIENARKLYRESAQDIIRRYSAVKQEWEEIKPLLVQLGILSEFDLNGKPAVTIVAPIKRDPHYKKEMGWLKKAVFAIHEGGPMSSLEIVDYLVKNFEEDLNVEVARNSLPATLSVAAKEGKIHRTKRDNGEYVYEIDYSNIR